MKTKVIFFKRFDWIFCYFFSFSGDIPRIKLVTFKIVGNQLQKLGTSLSNSKIYYLYISGNKLQFLAAENFNLVSEIHQLYLQENEIRRIEADTFKSVGKYLQILDLSFNKISSINGSVRFLSHLNELKLPYNRIKVKYSLFLFYSKY